MSKIIKFKRLSEDAIIPKKATEGSIAFDVYVPKDIVIEKGRQVIPLEFAIELPIGYEAKIEARSGFSLKGMEGHSFYVDKLDRMTINSNIVERYDADVIAGKVDSDYRGSVGVIVKNNDRTFAVTKGTRIAQMTIYHSSSDWKFEEVEELSETERDKGGFGHSGTH